MSFLYHENGITTGQVDYFCLVCESSIRNKEDANSHILKPVHKKNLQTVDYCEQFKTDHVRKVKNGYFCEFCNILFPTTAKVNLHLQDKKHITNRGNQLLSKIGNVVTAFGHIRISENAWNGFIDQICTLCNIEYENEGIHKTAASHLINLIHKKVEFTSENDIYRKIDEDSFQCLTCNKELALSVFTKHFEENIHKMMYEKCIESYKDTNNNNEKIESQAIETKEKKIISQAIETKEKKIVSQAIETNEKKISGNNDIPDKVEPHNNGAIPKTPVASNNITKDKKTKSTALDIENRICKELNARNYIIRDLKGCLHCILCSMDLHNSPSEHLSTMHHQTLVKMHKERIQNNYEINSYQDQNHKTITPKKTESPQKKDISKIVDSISTFQKQDININFETFVASCKKCTEVIEFDFDAIQNHIDSHKNKPKVEKEPINLASQSDLKKGTLFSSPVQKKYEYQAKSRASSVSSCDGDIDELAKQHNLCYDRKRNCMYCEVCKVSVPMAKKNILEHVNGWNHKNNQPKLHVEKPKEITTKVVALPRKMLLNTFVREITKVENLFCNDMIVNNEFCITFESFIVIKKTGSSSIQCIACDVTLNELSTFAHIFNSGHLSKLEHSYVILVDDEFVREFGNKYHCGYCNSMEDSWSDMVEHFKTSSHINSRNSAKSRLETHNIEIANHNKEQERMDMFEMIRLMKNRRFM